MNIFEYTDSLGRINYFILEKNFYFNSGKDTLRTMIFDRSSLKIHEYSDINFNKRHISWKEYQKCGDIILDDARIYIEKIFKLLEFC